MASPPGGAGGGHGQARPPDIVGNGNLCGGNIAQNARHKAWADIFMYGVGQNLLSGRRGGDPGHGGSHDDAYAFRFGGQGPAAESLLGGGIGVLGKGVRLGDQLTGQIAFRFKAAYFRRNTDCQPAGVKAGNGVNAAFPSD